MITQEIDIDVSLVTPTKEAVFEAQGMLGHAHTERNTRLAEQAVAEFRRLAHPEATTCNITRSEFQSVYQGEGHNAVPSVIDQIMPEAELLTLFACTLGQLISDETADLFKRNDFAAATMLDAAASVGTDIVADLVERSWAEQLKATGHLDGDKDILRFSPGYCCWHISGQKKLFNFLQPERIGIRLNESYLMHPLKSISGVLIVAPWQTFDIDDTFPFCADCKTHSCRDRFAEIGKRHSH